MKRKKIIIFSLLGMILILSPFIKDSNSRASSGALKINDQVIFRKEDADKNGQDASIAIGDLFLSDKTKIDQEIREGESTVINDAESELFMREIPNTGQPFDQNVTSKLFQPDNHKLSEGTEKFREVKKSSRGLVSTILVVVGGAIFVVIGVFLGNRFTHYRIKKKVGFVDG